MEKVAKGVKGARQQRMGTAMDAWKGVRHVERGIDGEGERGNQVDDVPTETVVMEVGGGEGTGGAAVFNDDAIVAERDGGAG